MLGLTRGSGRGHLARATLESIAQQVADVVEAMSADAGRTLTGLRVDGGAAANDLLMQMQADLLGSDVVRSAVLETTGLGAAFLAGLGAGFWRDPEEVAARWRSDAQFQPAISDDDRARSRRRWAAAVAPHSPMPL